MQNQQTLPIEPFAMLNLEKDMEIIRLRKQVTMQAEEINRLKKGLANSKMEVPNVPDPAGPLPKGGA